MGQAVVSYDERTTQPGTIEKLVADAGYPATIGSSDLGGTEERL
jgi:hypothetical protein